MARTLLKFIIFCQNFSDNFNVSKKIEIKNKKLIYEKFIFSFQFIALISSSSHFKGFVIRCIIAIFLSNVLHCQIPKFLMKNGRNVSHMNVNLLDQQKCSEEWEWTKNYSKKQIKSTRNMIINLMVYLFYDVRMFYIKVISKNSLNWCIFLKISYI